MSGHHLCSCFLGWEKRRMVSDENDVWNCSACDLRAGDVFRRGSDNRGIRVPDCSFVALQVTDSLHDWFFWVLQAWKIGVNLPGLLMISQSTFNADYFAQLLSAWQKAFSQEDWWWTGLVVLQQYENGFSSSSNRAPRVCRWFLEFEFHRFRNVTFCSSRFRKMEWACHGCVPRKWIGLMANDIQFVVPFIATLYHLRSSPCHTKANSSTSSGSM